MGEINLTTLVLSAVAFAVLYVIAYRRYIFSLFDPLNVFLVSAVFASVMMVNTVEGTKWWVEFFCFQAAFYFGFTRNKLPRRDSAVAPAPTPVIRTNKHDTAVLECATGVLFAISLIANLYMGATAGFPVFSDTPTEAKVSLFMGGLGFVKRINGGLGIFIPCAALVLYVAGIHKRWWIAVFVLEAIFIMLGGSKSAVLAFVFILAYVGYHAISIASTAGRRFTRFIKPLFAAAVLWSLAISFIESGSVTGAVQALMVRAVMYADAIIWYYNPVVLAHYAHYNILDYIRTDLNSILGTFRIVPYLDPLGYTMVELVVGPDVLRTIVGPNVPFYIRADLFFGAIGGCVYSALVGYTVSFVRKVFFNSRGVGLLKFACLLTLAVVVFALPTDSGYFADVCFDTYVPVLIVVGMCHLAVSAVGYTAYQPAGRAVRM